MHITVIKCVSIVVLFSALFVMAGSYIYRKVIAHSEKHPISLIGSLAYFLGTALFLTVYQLSSLVFDSARVGLFIVLVVLAALSMISSKANIELVSCIRTSKRIFMLLLIAAFVFINVINIWLFPYATPSEGNSGVYRDQHIGSIHTGQHANIASYILEADELPILIRHHAGALLSSGPMLLGCNKPVFLLYLWLCVSEFAMIFLIYGLLRLLSLKRKSAVISTYAVLFGSSALSTVLLSVTPFIGTGYADIFLGFGIFAFFLVWLNQWCRCESKLAYSDMPSVLIVSLILNIFWVLTANEYIILSFALIGAMFFYRGWKMRFNLWILSSIYAATLVVAITQGGWFTPTRWLTDLGDLRKESYLPMAMPSKMNPQGVRIKSLSLGIGLFYRIASGPVFGRHTWDRWHVDGRGHLLVRGSFSKGFTYEAVWRLESILWNYLRVMFWPLSGFAMLGLYCLLAAKRSPPSTTVHLQTFCFCSFLTFAVGFVPPFIVGGGRKFVFNRFIEPGYLLGLICLMLAIKLFLKEKTRFKKYLVVGAISMALTIGPILGHGLPLLRLRAFKMEFFKTLVETSGMIRYYSD